MPGDFRAIISHPARQASVYRWPAALFQAGIPIKFLTGLYFKPNTFPYSLVKYLPSSRRGAALTKLEKRAMRGLDPDVVVSVSGPLPELVLRPLKRIEQWNAIHDWLAGRWIRRHARSTTPTVLHCFLGSSYRAFEAARARGITTLLEITLPSSAHLLVADERRRLGLPSDFEPPGSSDMCEIEAADYVVAQSQFTVNFLLEQGVAPRRIILQPMGVDVEQFHPGEVRDPQQPFRVIFAGQLGVRKGLHHLFEAWSTLDRPGAELILTGMPTDDYARPLLDRYKGIYRWLGFVPDDQLPAIYRDCSVFVLPSLAEGGSNVVYEALASGLPAIVSTNAGSAVRDGVEGFVIPVGDVDALRRSIQRLYDDHQLRAKMSVAARKQAERFTWQQFGRRLVLMYELILGDTQRSATTYLDMTDR